MKILMTTDLSWLPLQAKASLFNLYVPVHTEKHIMYLLKTDKGKILVPKHNPCITLWIHIVQTCSVSISYIKWVDDGCFIACHYVHRCHENLTESKQVILALGLQR